MNGLRVDVEDKRWWNADEFRECVKAWLTRNGVDPNKTFAYEVVGEGIVRFEQWDLTHMDEPFGPRVVKFEKAVTEMPPLFTGGAS